MELGLSPEETNILSFQVLAEGYIKMTAFWDMASYSLIALMMEAVRTSKMSVYLYEFTLHHI
jgi:hypothetical protein